MVNRRGLASLPEQMIVPGFTAKYDFFFFFLIVVLVLRCWSGIPDMIVFRHPSVTTEVEV